MPTPTGLPKVGEVWERTITLASATAPAVTTRFVVLERGHGAHWSLRVYAYNEEKVGIRQLWVDAAYWLAKGWLKYLHTAGPKTREKLGIT